jgi:peptide/nickel transport system substrate-binding protein
LAAIAAVIFFFTAKMLTATSKKDIPLVRYSQTEQSLNKFWPAVSGSAPSYDVNRQIFEGLVRFSDQNHLEPLLATGWSRSGDKQWLFQLRAGVRFHNGHVLTAAIARDSLIADIKNPAVASLTGNIAKVEAVSSQIRITTVQPDPILPNKLSDLLIFDTTATGKNSVANGTGPYTLKPNSVASASHLRLVATDDYYGVYQHVREIDITTAASPGVAGPYRRNQIDLGRVGYKDKLGNRSYSLLQAPVQSVWGLAANTRRAGSPAANAAVREAVSLTIDPNTIIKTAGLAAEITTQLLPKFTPGYNASIRAQAHNLDTARQRLVAAGYSGGVNLQLAYDSTESPTVVLLRSQLAAVGINITLLPQPTAQAFDAIYKSGAADLYLINYSVRDLDTGEVLSGVLQSPLYRNEAATALLATADTTFDTARRADLLAQVSDLIAADRAVTPLYARAPNLYICDPAYQIHKDVPGDGLGVYFGTVYANK